MNYIYETIHRNYEDYASGRVLYNMPGSAPFPVRLGSEIFARCKSFLVEKGFTGPYTVYDPFCGSGYLLTVLGFLHNTDIRCIKASDVDERMVEFAKRNLGLLSIDGLNERISKIEALKSEFGKESHIGAFDSALRFKSIVELRGDYIPLECFCTDASNLVKHNSKLESVDIVIADLPYGNLTNWSYRSEEEEPIDAFLESMYDVLPAHSVAAVICDKKQKVCSRLFRRVDHFNVGKRRVVILEKSSDR